MRRSTLEKTIDSTNMNPRMAMMSKVSARLTKFDVEEN